MREQGYKNNNNNSQPNKYRGGETKVMKKILNLVLVFALLLTMVTPAFAETSAEDLGDAAVAVDRLKSLGVITGHGDGTFKPDDTITRAEFAAMAVRLVGLEGAAKVASGTSTFKDSIPSWAVGYVNVAAEQGIITGHGDGTFKPNDPVSQAEALTMLVRALGYEPAVNKNSAWPTNYLVVASQIGLTDGVDVYSKAGSTRGETAIFANNALTTPKMIQVGFGATAQYVISGTQGTTVETLLGKDLKATSSVEVLTSSTLTTDGKVQFADSTKNAVAATNYIVADGNTLVDLLGHEVEVIKVGGKVVFVADAAASVTTKTVNTDVGALDITFKGDTTATVLDTDAQFFFNGVVVSKVDFNTLSPAEFSAKVVFNADGEIQSILANNYALSSVPFESYTAKTALNPAKVNYYNAANLSTTATVNLEDTTVVTLNGQSATLADLQEFDLIYTVEVGGKITKVEAFRNTVTGGVTSKVVGTNTVVTLGGTNYTLATTVYGDSLDVSSTAVYKVGLNKDGKVAYVELVTGSNNDVVGIVVSKTDVSVLVDNVVKAKDRYTVFKADGTTTTFDLADAAAAAVENEYGKFTFKADGTFVSYTQLVADVTDLASDTTVTKKGTSILELGTGNFFVTSSTLFIDVTKDNATTGKLDPKVVSYTDLKTTDMVKYTLDGNNLKYVFITEGGAAVADEALSPVYGVYVGKKVTTTVDGDKYFATLEVNGVETDIEINNDFSVATLAAGDFVKVSDAVKQGYDTIADVATVTVTAVDATAKTVATATDTYGVTAKTTIYVYDVSEDKLTTGLIADVETALAAGDVIQLDATGVTYGAGGTIKEAAVIFITTP